VNRAKTYQRNQRSRFDIARNEGKWLTR